MHVMKDKVLGYTRKKIVKKSTKAKIRNIKNRLRYCLLIFFLFFSFLHMYVSFQILSYTYIWSLNAWLLLCPRWLCFDWSMGCVQPITSLLDIRLVPTAVFVVAIIALLWVAVKRDRSVWVFFAKIYVCALWWMYAMCAYTFVWCTVGTCIFVSRGWIGEGGSLSNQPAVSASFFESSSEVLPSK